MSNIGLNTENLKVGYSKKVILDGISFTANKGEILTLIGPNGAGKSTVLKTITRQLEKLGGNIVIGDKDFEELNEKDISKKMSMVMTDRINTLLMTCGEMVATGRYPYTGMLGILSDQDKKIVKESLELLNALDIEDMDFGSVSDGQRQRVMLARAICQEPEILVLDEPTSFLDVKFKLDILGAIRKLAIEKNIAVIMSLHELDLAMKISDTLLTVNEGKITNIGSPEEIFFGDIIQKLYGINEDEFDSLTGRVHFRNVRKTDDYYFVIAGGGYGISEFYKLYRNGISFATGIIASNDVDYAEAMALSIECVSTKAFSQVTQSEIDRAKELIDNCEKCVLAVKEFGPLNRYSEELRDYAISINKL